MKKSGISGSLHLRLKEHRTRCGLSQKSIALRLSVDDTTYSKWETGAAMPPLDAIEALAGIFGVTVSELLGVPSVFGELSPSDLALVRAYHSLSERGRAYIRQQIRIAAAAFGNAPSPQKEPDT